MFKEKGSFLRSYMLNVSKGGLFIKTANPLPLESKVMLQVIMPGDTEKIIIEGIVVWANPANAKNSFPSGMGIKFNKMDLEQREKIEKFVEEHRKDIKSHSIF